MKSTKLLFCDNTLWGLVNFRGDVIKYFKNQGYNIVLVAPEKEDEQMRTAIPQDVKYIPVKMGRTTTNPLNDLEYFIRLLKIFNKEKPDFVFNYTIKPNIYGSIAAKINKCHTTAMITGLGFTFQTDTLKTRIARLLYKIGLKFTDNLLVLNSYCLEIIQKRKLCNKNKVILLEGGEGVNLDKFKFQDNKSGKIIFMFIGRLLWDKGYDEFTKAARIVKKEYPETKFQLLGALDPSYPKSVPTERIKQDEKDGLVEYMGFTNNMNDIYMRKGLVITLPSYTEGMNRTLMEACACGKPIITTDIPGCRELVIDNKNGFVVKPKDVLSLSEAMKKYIKLSTEKKLQFSRNSRTHAEEKFDVKNVIKIYEQIINQFN